MKKILALLLMVVISFSLLTACQDPVYDDFNNFLNGQMTEVNANYENITGEASRWGEIEDDADLIVSLKDVLIPLVDDTLAKLENITPATDEVKAVKDKFVVAMEKYKEGFEKILAGFEAEDAEQIEAGNAIVAEGVTAIEEYNAALEALAAEVGAEIEY